MAEIKFEIEPGVKIYPENYEDKLIGLPAFPVGSEDVLDFDLCPSIRDLAVLCQMSYSKYDDIAQALKDNKLDYQLLCCVEKGSHHGSAFFRKAAVNDTIKRHRQLIIAFRGTEGFDYEDWEANLQGVVRNEKTPQINSAITFALKIVGKIYDTGTRPSLSNPLQIIVTGHSLGGWLAQFATLAIKHLQLPLAAKGNFRPFMEKEGRSGRYHPSCVTFDSPGTKLMLQYICDFPEIKFRYDQLHLDIVNYVIFPNAVNVVNPHYGDIVQISSERLLKALSIESELNKNSTQIAANAGHTSDFHSIKRFVEILDTGDEKLILKAKTAEKSSLWETIKQTIKQYMSATWERIKQYTLMTAFYVVWGPIKTVDWESDSLKEFSSQVEYKQVNSWPVAIFQGYNTKPDYVVNYARVKVFRSAIRNFRHDPVFTEYSQWLKNKQPCNSLALLPGSVSLSVVRLSEKEKGIVEQLERIRYWKEYLAKDSANELEAVIKDKEMVSGVLEKGYEYRIVWDRILFESELKYRWLKNFAVFYKTEALKSVVEGLTNYKNAGFILDGAWYIDSELLKYRGIGFSRTDLGIQFNPGESNVNILTYDCEHRLRLQLLKWMFIKRKQNLGHVLILKHDPRFPVNFFESLHNIKLVIVECTGSDISDEEIRAFSYVPTCKYVWIKHMARRTGGNSIPKFVLDQTLLDSIFSKTISVQGQICALEDVITEKKEDLEKELNADCNAPKSILDFFSGNAEVVKMPKTVFEDKSTYFEIGRTMNDSQLRKYYSDPKLGESSIIVFFAAEFNGYIVDRAMSDDLLRTGIVVIVLHDLGSNRFEDAFEKFKNICRAEPSMTVDLVSCKALFGGTHQYELMLQYNPEFYKKRRVLAPTLKMCLICDYLSANVVYWNISSTSMSIGASNPVPVTSEETCLEDLKQLIESFHGRFHNIIEFDVEFTFSNLPHGYYLRVARKGAAVSERVEKYYRSEEMEDSQLFVHSKFLVLSDEPGMGKSTTIYKLAEEMLQENNNAPPNIEGLGNGVKLLIFIELKTLELSKLETVPRHSAQFLEMFLECIASNQCYNVITRFLVKRLCDANKVIMICDGFDEMTKSNKQEFRQVLFHIRKSAKIKLIVTTRPHDSPDLQRELWTLAHGFVPLDNEDVKIDFLMTLWSSALRYKSPKDIADCSLRIFAKEVIRRAHSVIIKNREAFLGVPLQLRILAVVFLPKAEKYVKNYGKEGSIGLKILEEHYTLVDIYNEFVKRKYELYISQKIGVPENLDRGPVEDNMSTNLEPKMYWLAGKSLKWGKNLENLIVELYGIMAPEMNETEGINLLGVGLVYGTELEFIHRTIAEFFVSKLLILAIKQACFSSQEDGKDKFKAGAQLARLIWMKVLSKEGEVVRLFMEALIENTIGSFSERQCNRLPFPQELQNEKLWYPDKMAILMQVIDQRQFHFLDFFIHACKVSHRVILALLQHCKIDLTQTIFEKPSQTVFVMLKRLNKICESKKKDFKSFAFLAVSHDKFVSIQELSSKGGRHSHDRCVQQNIIAFRKCLTAHGIDICDRAIENQRSSIAKKCVCL